MQEAYFECVHCWLLFQVLYNGILGTNRLYDNTENVILLKIILLGKGETKYIQIYFKIKFKYILQSNQIYMQSFLKYNL